MSGRHRMLAAGVSVSGVVLGLFVGLALAQSGHGHQPSGHSHQPGAATADAPHRRIEAFQREIDQVLADGRGAGLAFAADQNGYPGPLHVLELTRELGITTEQQTRLAAAEAKLARLFAERTADEGTVRAAVTETEVARRDVRLVHLMAHLQTRDVLTEAQRLKYHELRWGQTETR